MIRTVLAGLISAAMLAACTPVDVELDGDLAVNGMEPAFWAVRVDRAAGISTISILGGPDFKGEAPVKAFGERGAITLTSKTAQGDFVMTLKRETCLDGLDNSVEYEWSVTVPWKGETLKGCARPADKTIPPKPKG